MIDYNEPCVPMIDMVSPLDLYQFLLTLSRLGCRIVDVYPLTEGRLIWVASYDMPLSLDDEALRPFLRRCRWVKEKGGKLVDERKHRQHSP